MRLAIWTVSSANHKGDGNFCKLYHIPTSLRVLVFIVIRPEDNWLRDRLVHYNGRKLRQTTPDERIAGGGEYRPGKFRSHLGEMRIMSHSVKSAEASDQLM
jgi:hypothetical protein